MNAVESFIAHYGVRGMHWGVRHQPARRTSSDYKKTAGLRKKKAHELTNKQLKAVNERKNLEQNFHRLNPGKVARGLAFTGMILGAAGMATRMYDIYNHPGAKASRAAGKAAMEHNKRLVAQRKLLKRTGQLQLFKP